MSLPCPLLDGWIEIYERLQQNDGTLNLRQVEQALDLCLKSESLHSRRESHLPRFASTRLEGGDDWEEDSFDSDGSGNYEELDEDMYYVYTRNLECPFFKKAIETLDKHDETFTVLNPDFAFGIHSADLESHTSSPQIFYGPFFIPGGSEGIVRRLESQKTKTIPKEKPKVKQDTESKPEPEPKAPLKKWYIYGMETCPACRQAKKVLGSKAHFIELRDPVYLHSDHKAQLSESQQVQVLQELKQAKTVPQIYFLEKHVPNTTDLAEKVRLSGGDRLDNMKKSLELMFPDKLSQIDAAIDHIIEEHALKKGIFGWSISNLNKIQESVVALLSTQDSKSIENPKSVPIPSTQQSKSFSKETLGDNWWFEKRVVSANHFIKETTSLLERGAIETDYNTQKKGGWLDWQFQLNNDSNEVEAKLNGIHSGAISSTNARDWDGNAIKMRIPFYVTNTKQQSQSFKCIVSAIMNFIILHKALNPDSDPNFSFKMMVNQVSRGQCGKEINFMVNDLKYLNPFVKHLKTLEPCLDQIKTPRCDMTLLRYKFQPLMVKQKEKELKEMEDVIEMMKDMEGPSKQQAMIRMEELGYFLRNLHRSKFEFRLASMNNGEWIVFRDESLGVITFELYPDLLDKYLGLEKTIELLKSSGHLGELFERITQIYRKLLRSGTQLGYIENEKEYMDSLFTTLQQKSIARLKEFSDVFSFPIQEEIKALEKVRLSGGGHEAEEYKTLLQRVLVDLPKQTTDLLEPFLINPKTKVKKTRENEVCFKIEAAGSRQILVKALNVPISGTVLDIYNSKPMRYIQHPYELYLDEISIPLDTNTAINTLHTDSNNCKTLVLVKLTEQKYATKLGFNYADEEEKGPHITMLRANDIKLPSDFKIGQYFPELYSLEIRRGDTPKLLSHISLAKKLSEIDITQTTLKDTLPKQLGQLQHLNSLHIADCELSGRIPTEIGLLQKLKHFIVNHNNLTGSIPTEIGLLQNLIFFDVGNNTLIGQIPTEIGTLPLFNFTVKHNKLTGPIPTEIGNLTMVEELMLEGNQLSGPIPTEIGKLTLIDNLFLDNNQLTGSIPTEIGNCEKMLSFTVVNNKLSGTIPIEMGNFEDGASINLKNNDFTGTIPSEITNSSKDFEISI